MSEDEEAKVLSLDSKRKEKDIEKVEDFQKEIELNHDREEFLSATADFYEFMFDQDVLEANFMTFEDQPNIIHIVLITEPKLEK